MSGGWGWAAGAMAADASTWARASKRWRSWGWGRVMVTV